LNKAVRAPPIWRSPVGLGANRVLTRVMVPSSLATLKGFEGSRFT